MWNEERARYDTAEVAFTVRILVWKNESGRMGDSSYK